MQQVIFSFKLDLLENSLEKLKLPFEKKLDLYLSLFKDVYHQAQSQFPNRVITFVCHEYAIKQGSASDSRILSYTQHQLIQKKLNEFTEKNKGCVILFPYAYTKDYHGAERAEKLKKISDRYKSLPHDMPHAEEQDHLTTYTDKFSTSAHTPLTVVRNVCYIFGFGKRLAKVDKSTPCNEYTNYSSGGVLEYLKPGHTLFQPGLINRHFYKYHSGVGTQEGVIEICADHAFGLAHSQQKASGRGDLNFHIILSNSTLLKGSHAVGKVTLLCDPLQGTVFIAEKETRDSQLPIVFSVCPSFGDNGIDKVLPIRVHPIPLAKHLEQQAPIPQVIEPTKASQLCTSFEEKDLPNNSPPSAYF